MQLLELEGYFDTVFDPKESHQAFRKKAWDRFLELGLPRPKQEAFQYFPLEKLQIPLPATTLPQNAGLLAAPHSLLFADGYFQGANLPSPLVCLKWDAAMLVYGVFLQNRFSRSLKEETDPIAAMNGAFQGKGAFLYVPPQTQLEEPIEIHHHMATGLMASPRLQIVLGVGARVQIVQRAFGVNEAFWNAHIDVSLDAGASLAFVDAPHWPEGTTCFQSFRSTLKRDSRFHLLSLSKGAKLARSSIKVQLLEENGEALLQGLSMLDADLESHTHVLVEHIAPHCRSRQHYKGILRGKSRSSFEGKILVRPLAQKTEAYQLSNTLLLSDEAKGAAKPNLEIFADDVKASHGATVSEFNVEELFYLRSRGMTKSTAEETLAAGFCQEILNAVPQGISL